MSGSDDYVDDMRRLNRLSDRDIERLLDGKAPAADETFAELATHLSELKATSVAEVPEAVAQRHLAAIADSARQMAEKGELVAGPTSKAHGPDRVSGLPKPRRGIMSNRFVLLTTKLGAVFVGASMLMAGAAFAGADLPDQVAQAFEKAGVTLPNQSDSGAPEGSESGNDVSDYASSDAEKGCEFGQSVAALAKQAADDHRQDAEHRQDDLDAEAELEGEETEPCTEGDEETFETLEADEAQGSRATGETKSAEGRAKADEASGGRSTAGAGNAATGEDKASTAPSGGKSTGEEKSSTAPSGGQSTGEDKSSTAPSGGQSTGEEKSSTAPQGGSDRAPADEGDTEE